ncbi:MAG: hypothetical protein U0136_17625 [Bdellovibrionota bacterium]
MTGKLNDLINPVMVKELRQDLRGRVFVGLFLWSQFFLASAVCIDIALTDALNSQSKFFVGTMWFILLGSLFIIFPGRAWNSFQRERKAESLELILLTNLSSLRLIYGKWLSIAAQCALVVTALLPYMVLQYFVNRTDIVDLLGTVFITCSTTAVVLAAGVCNSAMTRGKGASSIFGVIGILILLWMGSGLLFGGILSSRGLARSLGVAPTISDAVLVLIYGPAIIFQLLLIGASHIAAVHENYAGAKRLMALLVLALTWMFLVTGFGRPSTIVTLSAAFMIPILISSCFEAIHPFLARRVRVKRVTPWLSYAGWPQGMLFSLVAQTAYLEILQNAGVISPRSALESSFLLFSGIVLPRALSLNFPGLFGKGFLAYAIIQAIVSIVPTIIGEAAPYGSVLKPLNSFSPLFIGLYSLGSYRSGHTTFSMTYFISLIVILLLVRAMQREYRSVVAEASADGPRS